MDLLSIKTGDIFYYEDHIPGMSKAHRYKCRVLFLGTENLFYDSWWDVIDKWTFVPVRKRLTYYRFPLTQLHRLTFNGFEAIDSTSADKLFLQSPEILLRTTKKEISKSRSDNGPIEVHSEAFYFVPMGPKGGWLKPVFFNSKQMTTGILIEKVLENQNFDFIPMNEIVIDRIGLHRGVPSYNIRRE